MQHSIDDTSTITTSTTTMTTTLGDLVTQDAAAARVLEGFGLDYCCGGGRALAQACAEQGVDPDEVLAALSASGGGAEPEWATMSAAELVDHLEATHHRYLDAELPRLTALADKVVGVHGERHPELVEVRDCLRLLREELEPHLVKEERVLFPMIRELSTAPVAPSFHCGSLRNPISVMLGEHDRAGDLLARLRRASGGSFETPADGCASYRALYAGLSDLEADTHLHIHKENNVLFPAVVRLEAERRTEGDEA